MKQFAVYGLLALFSICAPARRLPYPTQVVAKRSFLHQTAEITPTTIFTPSANGNYRIEVYVSIDASFPSCKSGTEVSPVVLWTDEFHPQYQTTAGALGCPSGQGSVVFRVKGGTPIQISAGYGGGSSNDSYDMFVTVVKE